MPRGTFPFVDAARVCVRASGAAGGQLKLMTRGGGAVHGVASGGGEGVCVRVYNTATLRLHFQLYFGSIDNLVGLWP